MEHLSRPVMAGILTALVGFTSSSAVVLAGLRAVGASPAEAASGLLSVCVTQALGILWLARRHRIPITLAWSTPGAALLASTGVVHGGWPAAIGAFLLVGALIATTGLWPRLGDLISAIPTPIAQAMLAGVVRGFPTRDRVVLEPGREVELGAGQQASVRRGVVWVRHAAGSSLYLGRENLLVGNSDSYKKAHDVRDDGKTMTATLAGEPVKKQDAKGKDYFEVKVSDVKIDA